MRVNDFVFPFVTWSKIQNTFIFKQTNHIRNIIQVQLLRYIQRRLTADEL